MKWFGIVAAGIVAFTVVAVNVSSLLAMMLFYTILGVTVGRWARRRQREQQRRDGLIARCESQHRLLYSESPYARRVGFFGGYDPAPINGKIGWATPSWVLDDTQPDPAGRKPPPPGRGRIEFGSRIAS